MIQTLVYQAPTQQMQGVSKTDFENYVKANDVVLRNMQNQGQGLQNQMTNLTEMLSKFIPSNTASSSNSGTLPSQTVTNPREHVNAITIRSGKTCEGPSTPLVPTPVISIPSKEPIQNLETSMDKVQKPSLESTAQVPPPEEEDSIFIEILKPKAKKTVNIEIQRSLFAKNQRQIGLKDALVEMPKFNKWLSGLLRNKEKLEEITITTVEPFSGSTTNHSDALPPSSSPVKTSDNLEEFADELTLLKKDVHFQVYSNPLFDIDVNFTSSKLRSSL
ncbi:hypothetical protein Tco_1109130 [Tanacetum coccineum]